MEQGEGDLPITSLVCGEEFKSVMPTLNDGLEEVQSTRDEGTLNCHVLSGYEQDVHLHGAVAGDKHLASTTRQTPERS